MLGWKITDSLELSLLAMKQDMHLDGRTSFSTEDLDLPNSPTLNGGPLPSKYYTSDHARSSRDDEIEMYSAKLVFNQDWGTITAASSLFERYSGYMRDASAAAEVLSAGRLHADSTGISLIGGRDGWPKAWIRSSELRYSSDWDSPVQILVGAYNQNEERRDGSYWATVDPTTGRPGPNPTVFLSRTSFVQLDQVALFGEVTWNVTDRLVATAGLRWFDYDTIQDASRLVDFQSRARPRSRTRRSSSASRARPARFNVSYDLTDDVLAYVQIAEGFRAGGPNDQTAASIANVQIPAGFGSDSIINYELGLKTSAARSPAHAERRDLPDRLVRHSGLAVRELRQRTALHVSRQRRQGQGPGRRAGDGGASERVAAVRPRSGLHRFEAGRGSADPDAGPARAIRCRTFRS